MDGEEDDFMSGGVSDDGGGTPVQDEHPASDSDGHQTEDEGSNDEAPPPPMETDGADSDDKSDSEAEPPRPADSDDDEDSPIKRRMSASDVEDDEELPRKRRRSESDNEASSPIKHVESDGEEAVSPVKHPTSDGEEPSSPIKHTASDGEEPSSPIKHTASDGEEPSSPIKHTASDGEEPSSPIKHTASDGEEPSSPVKRRRGSSSDVEDDGDGEQRLKASADSESENEEKKPTTTRDTDSDTETHATRTTAPLDSDEEEKQEVEEGEGRKWKAVMQSDSEEEEHQGRRKAPVAAAGSDEEEEEGRRAASDEEEKKPVKRKNFLSDSEDEEEDEEKPAVKKRVAMSDDDDDSDASVGPDKSLAAKLKELGSASSSEEEERAGAEGHKDEKALFGSDSESGDEEEKMIADIFGESGDEEEEEFTGFNQEDLEGDKHKHTKEKTAPQEAESDSDEGVDRSGQDTSFMSDFDMMLARKKAMNSRKRRHRDGGTFISDADDVVSAMIVKMTEAAEEDRVLNSQKKLALKKLMLLPQVVRHLKKQDLKETFIDSGVMSAIKEWIGPLPDKSLPALKIREELLKILHELPSVSQETLKHSGIGRAVMFLYKHPKESRSNKDLALKLINEWSRPIFGLTSNYKGMTREERQQRDLDQQMPQRRRLREPLMKVETQESDVFSPPSSSGGQTPRRDLEKQLTGEEKALRPGDPGFCARARVPMPSNKDYVVRPKWNVEGESNRSGVRKAMGLLEKHKRRFAEQRKRSRPQGAVKISIEGNRMPL
ncbi:protein IWS1 homolog isoform X2 [Gouania willdenowi]|uniref:TFIIS N-terminal domain-containing protein n=1 Tax=Gouania willdenowi TaxID=441366 RepID=A0A8C5E070_GOUWI|nr:protein IWS1 homolog isoform X2 [Gouania willdenowi]